MEFGRINFWGLLPVLFKLCDRGLNFRTYSSFVNYYCFLRFHCNSEFTYKLFKQIHLIGIRFHLESLRKSWGMRLGSGSCALGSTVISAVESQAYSASLEC